MKKVELIKKIGEIVKTDLDLNFLAILKKEELSENITLFEIQAPDIARKAKPGTVAPWSM